jgi:hypothetical protein
MLGYFPSPYPDELLYSVCARLDDLLQYPSKRTLAQELFGSRSALAVIDLPSHLDALVSVLPSGCSYMADDFIDRHTLLPFYGPFLPPGRLQRVRADMRGDNGPRVHSRAGIMASKVSLPLWLRFCSACVAQDRERLGQTYWHRVHQVPGVEICSVHGVLLQSGGVRARNARIRYEFVSAEQAVQEPEPRSPEGIVSHHEALLQIAYDAAWLLDQRDLAPGINFFRQRYIARLIDQGLATHTGRVRGKHLMQAFRRYYPDDLLSLLHCELRADVSQNWLIRLLQPSASNAQHPLHHLLLIHFLGCTVEEFFALQLPTEKPFGTGPWPCLNQASEHYRQMTIDECGVRYSPYTDGRPIGTFSCDCGFVYSRTGPDSSPGDRFKVGQVLCFGPIWEARLRELWDNPGVSLRGIGYQLGVDPITAKRHADRLGLPSPRPGSGGGRQYLPPSDCLEEPSVDDALAANRETWFATIQANPGFGVKALREQVPAVYAWLYRNDREWLGEHSPHQKEPCSAPPRVNWGARDEQLAEAVKASAMRIRNAPGRPQRITVTSIGKDVSRLALLQKKLDKLPLTAESLTKVVESREVFAIRRIWWVAKCYQQEGVFPEKWQLVRRSGVGRVVDSIEVTKAIQEALGFLNSQKLTIPD